MLGSLKIPTLNASNVIAAVVIVVLAIKFQVHIRKAFAAAPLVGPAVNKFMTT